MMTILHKTTIVFLLALTGFILPVYAQMFDSRVDWEDGKILLKSKLTEVPPASINSETNKKKAMLKKLENDQTSMTEERSPELQKTFLLQVCKDIEDANLLCNNSLLGSAANDVKRSQDNQGHVNNQLTRAISGIKEDIGVNLSVEIEEQKQDEEGKNYYEKIWDGSLLTTTNDYSEMFLDRITDDNKSYRVILKQFNYKEVLYIYTKSKICMFGVKFTGEYPNDKAFLTLGVKPTKKQEKPIPVEIKLRDSDANLVYSAEDSIISGNEETIYYSYNIIPQEGSIGPFEAEINIDNDDLSFNANLKLSIPNSLIPVSSFEDGHPSLWFTGNGDPTRKRTSKTYDSSHMAEIFPVAYPQLKWNTEEKRSGSQSLELEYNFNTNAVVWSRLNLPGNATYLSVWVKGNNSNDKLFIHYVDKINYTLPSWAANPNTGDEFICKLNFSEWQKFRIPVYGDGLAIPSRMGSTKYVDAPIAIMAFRVESRNMDRGRTGEPTAIFFDDIYVETQTMQEERLTMELVQNEDTLSENSSVKISIGNGTGKDLSGGEITILVKEDNKVVYNNKVEMPSKKDAFTVREFSLKDINSMKLKGPVTIDFMYADNTVPGAKTSKQAVFKRSSQGGMYQDFELVDSFNSLNLRNKEIGESVSTLVPNGKGKALSIEVKGDGLNNNALLHPSLPGIPDQITMKVKGNGKPVTMQVAFIDSSLTGINILPYNVFWTKPIKVNWEGWKEITISAPTIPAHYDDKNYYFYRKPWYPLNLLVEGSVEKTVDQAQLLIDDIRVTTHLEPKKELSIAVDFPDTTLLYQIDAPLILKFNNLGETRKIKGEFELRHIQGFVAAEGAFDFEMKKGELLRKTIVPKLEAGIYNLTITGVTPIPEKTLIEVIDVKKIFGDSPMTTLSDPVALRRQLSLMKEKLLVDWDNSEGAPYLFNYNWFRKTAETESLNGVFSIQPLFGYSADWAGLEAQENIANNTYVRNNPNSIQIPYRLIDWDMFIREMAREFNKDFDEWIFWENPDLYESPQGIPTDQYADMLNIFYKWVKLYDPKAKVIAGGFNFDQALPYLDKVISDEETGKPNPEKLNFDAIAIQMNIGELAPERADLEGFLDDLNKTLQISKNKKEIHIAELDWAIGDYLSPLEQAAYHMRAQLILNSRNANRHMFKLLNGGNSFKNYGVFWKQLYGNNELLQTFRPNMVPKPSYFALIQTQHFLKEWSFVKPVKICDLNWDSNRAYIYKNSAGKLCVAYWRTKSDIRSYTTPDTWKDVIYKDGFSFDLKDNTQLNFSTLPVFAYFPENYSMGQLVYELRTLKTVNNDFSVIASIHPAEEDSKQRAAYKANGKLTTQFNTGIIPGGERITENFTFGITQESFQFNMPIAGNVLLSRIWLMDDAGQVLNISLNDAEPIQWDLQKGEGDFSGIRNSTIVLTGCKAGVNTVKIDFPQPDNTGLYRITPLNNEYVNLDKIGIIKTQQAKGDLLLYNSVASTPLKITDTLYKRGLGMHANGFIEYPLNKQFKKLEVTLGIDAVTEGRGTVKVRFIADGKVVKTTDIINGFTEPLAISIDKLDNINRLLIVVDDAGDGEKMDYIDLVDGKLFYKVL